MDKDMADSTGKPTRNIFLRILFGFLWFVLLRIITGGILGGIVGGLATTGRGNPQAGVAENFQNGANAGAQAALEFFHKYGLLVLLCQIVLFAVLCAFRLLPGVAKYKKVKPT
jgi:hypothetical protein